ncbi:MAG: 50S ribosomal protein L32 [Chloroflexi bacterium]|nr:50S ribosomal protein L32 [Chloroflexota bacterium]
MAVPKRRTPPAKQGRRRSHHALVTTQLARCPQCRAMRPNHRVCPVCGFYNGRQVLGPAGETR